MAHERTRISGSLPSRKRRNLRLAAAVVSLLILALLFEGFCQIYARMRVFPTLESLRESPRHYYLASKNPVLGYELKPSSEFTNGERLLRINRFGIREDRDEVFEGKRKLAILGDSVVFGVDYSQEETIPARVQRQIDPDGERIKVLNFSVGGYEIAQLLVQLQEKNRIYDVDDVVYLLNLNDFSRKNSIYEGADNGNYRIYVRPSIMSIFLVRKAIYRMMKGGKYGSERWYRWFYEGNEERGQTLLSEMARYGRDEGFRFGVILLPSGLAYSEHGYGLRDVHERLGAFLSQEGISFLDPVDIIGTDLEAYYTPDDHFYDAGNERMAELIVEFVRSEAFGSN